MEERQLPGVVPLAPAMGVRQTLVVVPGFLSTPRTLELDHADWVVPLRRAGWHGAIYKLAWESGGSGELLLESTRVLTDLAAAWFSYRRTLVSAMTLFMPVTLPAKRMRMLLGGLAVLYTIQRTLWRLHTYWRRARGEAREAAAALAREGLDRVLPAPPHEVTLVGFSLGGYLVREMLIEAAREGVRMRQAFCIAPAAQANAVQEWEAAARGVSEPLVNVYSPNDLILRMLYTGAEWHTPAGIAPVHLPGGQIVNINAAWHLPSGPVNAVASHMGHLHALPRTIGPWLECWEQPGTHPRLEEPYHEDIHDAGIRHRMRSRGRAGRRSLRARRR